MDSIVVDRIREDEGSPLRLVDGFCYYPVTTKSAHHAFSRVGTKMAEDTGWTKPNLVA